METFTKDVARVRTKRTWLLGASIAAGVVSVAPVVAAGIAGASLHIAQLLAVAASCAFPFGLLHAWNGWWSEQRGQVRADERGLWLDGVLVVGRHAVRHGHVLARGTGTYVRLGRMLRLIDIAVADAAEGRALLTAMRLDASRSVGQYPMTHGTYRANLACGGIIVASAGVSVLIGSLVASVDALFASLAVWTVVAMIWTLNSYVRVSVGADGVRLRRLLRRPRFLPFFALESAKTDGRDVRLTLRDGSLIEMHHPAGGGRWKLHVFADRAEDGRMLVERIEAQAERHRCSRPDDHVLSRAGRGTQEWLQDVARASDEHASFREAAIPADELWRAVEDSAASSSVRAGAAMALRSRLDADGRTRIGDVAAACADQRLRLALQAVASADDDTALAQAFDHLYEERRQRR